MDIIISFVLGVVVSFLLTGKSININIKHTNENPPVTLPVDPDTVNMYDLLNKTNSTEDDIYAAMGETINDIDALMTGGEINEKE